MHQFCEVCRKLQVVYEHSTYQMTALLSVFSVLELDVRHDWWVMAPNTHCSFFPMSHLCVLTCKTWKLQLIYGWSAYQMTALLSKTFLVWFTVARDSSGELLPQTRIICSLIQNCVYIASRYIHRYLVRNYAWQQNSRTLWQHTTHQMITLLPTMHHFITAKLASYITCCSAFSINRVHYY